MRRRHAIGIAVATASLIALVVYAQPITGGGGLTKVNHSTAMTGTGTTASPLDLAHTCSNTQVLQWNGTAWACANSSSISGLTTNQTVKAASSTTIANAWPADDATTWGVASKFTITEASGNFRTFGTGTIDGAATLSSTLGVTGVQTDSNALVVNSTAAADATGNGSLKVIGDGTNNRVETWWDKTSADVTGIDFRNSTHPRIRDFTNAVSIMEWAMSTGLVEFFNGVTLDGTLGVTGLSTLTGGFDSHAGNSTVGNFRGTVITPSALASGRTDNYAPASLATATIIDVDPNSSNSQISGLTGGVDGRYITFLANQASGTLCFNNEDTNSTAANRFNLNGGAQECLYPNAYWAANGAESMTFVYSGNLSRWVEVARASDDMNNLEVNGSAFFTSSISQSGGQTAGLSNTTVTQLQVNGNATIGNAATNTISFSNGPTGVNLYAGTYYEQVEEFDFNDQSSGSGVSVGPLKLSFTASGTGTTFTQQSGAEVAGGKDDRMGIVGLTTGTATAGGYASLIGGKGFTFSGVVTESPTLELTAKWPTLSSSTNSVASEYVSVWGFTDEASSAPVVNVNSGCYFAYDKGNVLTGNKNASNVDAVECWCANAGTRTGYLINASGNSDESFALGTGTIAADTWYRYSIVMTGHTRAEFYRATAGTLTKVCDINTNVPTAAVAATFIQFPEAATGTGARLFDLDEATLKVTRGAARSP